MTSILCLPPAEVSRKVVEPMRAVDSSKGSLATQRMSSASCGSGSYVEAQPVSQACAPNDIVPMTRQRRKQQVSAHPKPARLSYSHHVSTMFVHGQCARVRCYRSCFETRTAPGRFPRYGPVHICMRLLLTRSFIILSKDLYSYLICGVVHIAPVPRCLVASRHPADQRLSTPHCLSWTHKCRDSLR
jgi:hypothetical protein